jgi:hypothetical protein
MEWVMITQEQGSQIRFTQTLDAFYVMTLSQPKDTIVLDFLVPWVAGDPVQQADQYAWIFKISYGGMVVSVILQAEEMLLLPRHRGQLQ